MSWETNTSGAESPFHGAENKLEGFGHEVAHFAELTGEAALHAAIQEPIDGLTQLTNHIVKPLTGYELPTLHLVDAPPPAKFGSEDWLAETVGTGLGRALDYVVLAAGMEVFGVTAAVGSALGAAADLPLVSAVATEVVEHPVLAQMAVNFGKGALPGLIYGGAIMPSKSENDAGDFWRDRTIGSISWGLAGGVAGAVAEGANLAYKGLGMPVEDEAFQASAQGLSTRAVTAILRGSSSGVVKTATNALLGQEAVSAQLLSERVLQGIAKSAITAVSQ